jgi:glycosyltransferase involved in cell wall biosynthesis
VTGRLAEGFDAAGSRPSVDIRLAVILPARTEVWGGVQRFGHELATSLGRMADVVTYRLHPERDQSRTVAALASLGRLLGDHRRSAFDAVLTTFHWPPSVPGLKTWGVIHDLRGLRGQGRRARMLQSLIVRSWSGVCVPTDHVADEVQDALGLRSRPSVIGEGLDHLDDFLAEAGRLPRKSVVVIGGRSEHKRARLGSAAAVIAAERLAADVVVVGPVPGSCPPSVSQLPAPTDRELAGVFGSARVVVAPSQYEGFGLAAGEALRCGAPVVYALDGTLGSLVKGGGMGCLPTPVAMASGICEAWARTEELAVEGRRAVEELTWEAAATRVLTLVPSARSGRTRRMWPRRGSP